MQDIKDRVDNILQSLDYTDFHGLPNTLKIAHLAPQALEMAHLVKELTEREAKLVEALKYIDKACLCERFPSRKIKRGFDYHESHPQLGNCSGGARWLTPKDKIKGTLEELGY